MTILHCGVCRYNAMGMNNPRICCPHKKRFNRDCCYSHGDGLLWTNKSLSAEWPYVLNQVLDTVSKQFSGNNIYILLRMNVGTTFTYY